MSMKPQTLGAIQDVARNAGALPMPEILPFTNGLLTRLTDHYEHIRQEDIAAMVGGFHAACALLMPPKTVDAYIADRCEVFDLPMRAKRHQRLMVIPRWSELHNAYFVPGASAVDRADSMTKFTHEEIMDMVHVMHRCPDLMVALGVFQQLVGEYLHAVTTQSNAARPQLGSSLLSLQEHWLEAGNFQKMLHAALAHTRPRDIPVERYFEILSQKHIDNAFDFLREARAFDLAIPGNIAPGGKKLVFTCPAQQILRQFFTEQGTFLRVVHTLRSADDASERNAEAAKVALLRRKMCRLVQRNADVIRDAIATGTRDDYETLERFDLILQEFGPDSTDEAP